MLFEKSGERAGAEAAALAVAAGHPGVVELVGVAGDVLRTTLLRDARPLAGAGPLTADELAGVVASAAATLADLHDLGVVHGGVDGGHVLLACDGRPVLCSLGRGGAPSDDVLALGTLAGALLAGCSSPPRTRSHLMQGRAGRGSRATTHAPAWQNRSHLMPGRVGRGSPSPGRAPGPWRLGRRFPRLGPMLAPDAAVALASVLAEATAAAPATRPTARALAVAVHQRVPTACLPRPAGGAQLPLALLRPPARSWRRTVPSRPPAGPRVLGRIVAGRRPASRREPSDSVAGRTRAATERGHEPAAVTAGADAVPADPVGVRSRVLNRPGGVRPPGHPSPAALAAAGVAMGVMVAAAVTVSPGVLRSRRPPAEPTVPPAGGGAVRRPPPSVPSPTTAPPPVAVRVWPPEPLDFHDGVLTIDGARYALGRPGDTVVAGDWACSGHSTLALLRPGTGEVFAFDDWPAEGATATARVVGTVAGATAARIVDADGDGCDDLELLRPGADPVRLEPAA